VAFSAGASEESR